MDWNRRKTAPFEPRAYGARGPLKQWEEPPHSKSWLRAWKVVAAGIAVHARVVDKLKGTGWRAARSWPRVYRAVLQVHCVFKGGPLPANLTVDLMGRPTPCHDTRVEIGEDYILLLKRGDDMYLPDMYLPDEVNHDSAAIPADQDHLDQVSRTCDLGDFTSPANTSAQLGCSVSWDGAGEDCLGAAAAGSVNRGSFGLTSEDYMRLDTRLFTVSTFARLGVALALMMSLPGPALSCSVVNWEEMSFPQQVVAAGIAVHASVLDKLNGTYGHWPSAYRAVLQVHCVFKGGPLPANLTVDEMGELTSCHHTRVEIGEDYILLLKREGDMYLPDEVNYLSVAFPADQEHFDQVSRTCDLGNFTTPANTSAQLGCSVSWEGPGQTVWGRWLQQRVLWAAGGSFCDVVFCSNAVGLIL
ncbi:hypothetical protein Bbelb_087590 [Branchiostoma belcheri]|nr:hypothetical protein Bbelb_087590 [Branchiostoma belcheri]